MTTTTGDTDMGYPLPSTLVYVDDEDFNLEELREALESRMANPIRLFKKVKDFIDWVSTTTEHIGLVLIDFIMPMEGMNGLELVQWCRTHRPDLEPLIVVTGLQDKYSQDQAKAAGADAYLIKPVTIGTLMNALTALKHHAFEVKPLKRKVAGVA